MLALVVAPVVPARADLRAGPVWWDQNSVGSGPDWHYRVAINVPGGSTVNSTVKVDVDFQALLTTMGVSGTFDVNSPRVVRANGTIATTQEFTDSVFAGATDATGNARGEVRFILEDAGATTYYLYFDITQNGTKPANPQTPINSNTDNIQVDELLDVSVTLQSANPIAASDAATTSRNRAKACPSR